MSPHSRRVYKCIACQKYLGRDKDLAFHNLPKDTERARKWLEILGREDLWYELHKRHVICSAHFHPCMFKETIGRKLLVRDAMPSPGPITRESTYPRDDFQDTEAKNGSVTDFSEENDEHDDNLIEARHLNTYKEALNYLGPLEQFALFKENLRVIGLINQIENIFRGEIDSGHS